MSLLDSKLKEQGVKEIKYYYENHPLVGNIFTVCVFLSEDKKILARGVSICSIEDSHNKKIGRKISKSRAIIALYKKENGMKINNDGISEQFNLHYSKFVMKSFKIKRSEDSNKLIKLADDYGFSYDIIRFDPFKRLDVEIPYNYPIIVSGKHFNFKSEYCPDPTSNEKHMFKL